MPCSQPPTGNDPHAWLDHLFTGSSQDDRVATAHWVLSQQSFRGRRLFSIDDAIDAVADFLHQGTASLKAVDVSGLNQLPAKGRNLFFLARLPGGHLHLRVFGLKGKLRFDQPIAPASWEVRELQWLDELVFTLRDSWNRSRFSAVNKAATLNLLRDLTGVAAPGRFYCVLASQPPDTSPQHRLRHILASLHNFVIDWGKRQAKHRGISLDELESDEDATGSSRAILIDKRSLPGYQPLSDVEDARSLRRAYRDLPAQHRQVIRLARKKGRRSGREPRTPVELKAAARERQRLHAARSAFDMLRALHREAETQYGQERIGLLALSLIGEESDRQLVIRHFVLGVSITRLARERGADSDQLRRAILRSAEALRPALDCRYRDEAVQLLPRSQRQKLEALLEDSTGKADLAERLDCSEADLLLCVRRVLAALAMAYDALVRSSSSTGKRYLAADIREALTGRLHIIATSALLERVSPEDIGRRLSLEPDEVRRLLLDALFRIYQR